MRRAPLAVAGGALSLPGTRALIRVMKNLRAYRPLAALMLIVLMLALSLQLAQVRPGVDAATADSMLMSQSLHCDDCGETSLMPDCTDGVCSTMAAMVGSDSPPGAVAAPGAEHAQIPLYHPGPGTAPEPQPPRMPIPV
ncbi:hypothetical protein [Marinobacterium aestuariivivens]|uniref:DUF2946 domain-containing protein n=1 Tax=Marinobacterium aestuariivivens TaxID=1698799 RepID=A0ABW1ZZC4_9GAMM